MNPALDEGAARRVVLVQAFDGAEGPLWTPEDRSWATRLASETAGADAVPERFLAERAHHALQRLAPRDAGVRRWLARRSWRPLWILFALALGFLLGLLVDSLGGRNLVDLLAPPVWAVIVWNLLVYAGLVVNALRPAGTMPPVLRRWALRLARGTVGGSAPLKAAALDWARLSTPLALTRLALLLHLAAAALALGLIAGLYLRGLVFDIRAGWQSTFLGAGVVNAWLTALLSPAVALTGIVVPDAAAMEALRITPGAAATASAAPWIHLYAVMLGLTVVLPRTLLAIGSFLRASALSRRFALPLDGPYFQQLLRRRRGGVASVRVLPHGAAPGPQAALGLRALLASVLGDDVQLQMSKVTAHGDEESLPALPEGSALCVALVDLGATPEVEAHGRFLQSLRAAAPATPLLLVADEAAFRRRFGTLPERLAQRRAAWQQLADSHRVGLLCADLDQPDVAGAKPALQALLG
ncbi:MAG TPA: DUF2868 domain-containing protein [Rubrivivax sp.]